MDYMATHWVMFTAIFAILTLLEVLNFAFTAHSAMSGRTERFGVGFGLHAILIGLTGIASVPMLLSIICALIQYAKH